uniref:Uncharacterized protein n=2 Tax=Ciona savignyi TaxID=51511 RepID=H2YVX0_CIOSA
MLRLTVLSTICLSLVAGCHYHPEQRHKRALSPPNARMQISGTSSMRTFFTSCMERRVSSDVFPSFQTILDYVVLDTKWYKNSDDATCLASSGTDTADCWIARITSLIDRSSPLYQTSMLCIAEFTTLSLSSNPEGGSSEISNARFKRQILVPNERDTNEYINCFERNLVLPDDRNPINVPILVRFIRNHTVCTGGELGDCQLTNISMAADTENFAYRLEALTRDDSPLLDTTVLCNHEVFPIVPVEQVNRTDECYAGISVKFGQTFHTERCASSETMCQTKIVMNRRRKIVEKKCKHGDACLGNWSANRQNCFGENAIKNGVRVCHFCCTGNLCNNSTSINELAN